METHKKTTKIMIIYNKLKNDQYNFSIYKSKMEVVNEYNY